MTTLKTRTDNVHIPIRKSARVCGSRRLKTVNLAYRQEIKRNYSDTITCPNASTYDIYITGSTCTGRGKVRISWKCGL